MTPYEQRENVGAVVRAELTASRQVVPVDIAASIASRFTPRALAPHIDQLRRDVRRLLGHATPTVPLDAIDPIAALMPSWLHGRYAQLQRDVGFVRRGLAGDRPPPFHTRRRAAPASRITTRSMRVVRVTRETDDAVSLTLTPMDGRPMAFVPGQFLTVQVTLAGERLRRAYSISSVASEDGTVTLTSKRMAEGRVSSHLNGHVHAGSVLDVLGPSGSFTVAPDASLARHFVLLAGGSGITPIMAIVRAVLRDEPLSTLTLIYGNRTWGDVIFAEALDVLAAGHGTRFRLRHVLSHPPDGWTGARGVLDAAVLREQLDALGVDDAHGFYLCGPEPMMQAARDELQRRCVPAERVHEERFTAPRVRAVPGARSTAPHVVTLRTRKGVLAVTVAAGQTVLEAGLAAGADLPFSCAMGGCGECRMKLVDGHVDVERPNCLTDQERADGDVLTCVGRPTTATILEINR